MKALKEGRINETIDDADFKDLSRHRGAVIQMALGSGKHTIKRMTIRKRETVGERGEKRRFQSTWRRKLGSLVGPSRVAVSIKKTSSGRRDTT